MHQSLHFCPFFVLSCIKSCFEVTPCVCLGWLGASVHSILVWWLGIQMPTHKGPQGWFGSTCIIWKWASFLVSGFWCCLSGPNGEAGAELLLRSEDGRRPTSSLFPCWGHLVLLWFRLHVFVLSCRSIPYCQLCVLASLFCVDLCLVFYFEVMEQASSASSMLLTAFQGFPRERQHFFPMSSSQGWCFICRLGQLIEQQNAWILPEEYPVLSHPFSHSVGCPWCTSLSMSVSLGL